MLSPAGSHGRRLRKRAEGFTLIELMIAVIVLGILAAIAYPQYTEFVQRSRIMDATSAMNDFRVRMEQFFQDNRNYAAGAACGVADPVFDAAASNFRLQCTLVANGYRLDAAGNSNKGMGPFGYRLVVDNTGVARSTTGAPAGWVKSATCWSVRKNGACT